MQTEHRSLVVAALGIAVFVTIASTLPIQNSIQSALNPKPQSHAATTQAQTGYGDNVFLNYGFEDGRTNWTFFTDTAGVFSIITPGSDSDKAGQITLSAQSNNTQIYQQDLLLTSGKKYRFEFDGRALNSNDLNVSLYQQTDPFTNYGINNVSFNLNSNWQHFYYEFIASPENTVLTQARLRFVMSTRDTYTVDNIQLREILKIGDINRDGVVDVFDLGLLVAHYGVQITDVSDEMTRRCDINMDKVVNVFDLGLLIANYGK
ncbi:hypothetical protein HGA91_02785 [candidate division WWE3 bacterium]|nr:hypothetical protein [candidate division WWE3 bacterium]